MSKRVLTVLLAVMLAVGIYTAVASAGVEGDFTFDFALTPQTTTSQLSWFYLNFEGILNLDVTLSGLTISNYMTFGIAGLETYVAGLSTTLGALDLSDEFWFSVPYSGVSPDVRLGTLQFVKKRVDASITLGGLSFDTLVVFEDVMFGYPYTQLYDSTKGYSNPDSVYRFGMEFTLSGTTVSGIGVTSKTGISLDDQLTNAVKKYHAGGAYVGKADEKDGTDVTLTGTPSGAYAKNATATFTGTWSVDAFRGPVIPSTVALSLSCKDGTTALVAGTDYSVTTKGIDKVSGTIIGTFTFKALKALTNVTCDTSKTKLTYDTAPQFPEFAVEKIQLTGIAIGPLTVNDYLEFRPATAVKNTIEITATMMGFDIDIALYTTDITAIGSFSSVTASAALGDYFTITWDDANANFTMDAGDSIEVVSSIPIQTATFSNDITIEPTVGITAAEFGMSLPIPIGTFTGSVTYGGSPLAWEYFDFSLSSTVGGIDLTLSSEFGITGLDNAHVTITIPFAA